MCCGQSFLFLSGWSGSQPSGLQSSQSRVETLSVKSSGGIHPLIITCKNKTRSYRRYAQEIAMISTTVLIFVISFRK
ncbi:hypothetical protein DAPPUDRAFT_307187 [Daphnia pulex]|uniref:Uncharacterized protein n=1 Tax=Daphnia pulex TaxID=6669 RepID=E9H0Z7_DAPPU|nr:hypothetical protein DAPPUDRAFT_307187 [Daphnia pulex]|eukprot:EFX74544.1 hypothetical protein DAPPUDRAFT_307187 [Daphnia pulex]